MIKLAATNVGDAALFGKLSLTALAGEEPMRACAVPEAVE